MPALISETIGVSREGFARFLIGSVITHEYHRDSIDLWASDSFPKIHSKTVLEQSCGSWSSQLRAVHHPLAFSVSLSIHPTPPTSFHKEEDRKHTTGSSRICKESLRKEVTVQMRQLWGRYNAMHNAKNLKVPISPRLSSTKTTPKMNLPTMPSQ